MWQSVCVCFQGTCRSVCLLWWWDGFDQRAADHVLQQVRARHQQGTHTHTPHVFKPDYTHFCVIFVVVLYILSNSDRPYSSDWPVLTHCCHRSHLERVCRFTLAWEWHWPWTSSCAVWDEDPTYLFFFSLCPSMSDMLSSHLFILSSG